MSVQARFWAKVLPEPNSGCCLWTASVDHNGYGKFGIDYRTRQSHRVSWELEHGPIPDGMSVLHRCDVPACVNPDHLFLGTKADNQRDMAAKGRSTRGERHGMSKLTRDQVRQIQSMVADGLTHSSIAVRFGVTRQTIGDIANGRRWGWAA